MATKTLSKIGHCHFCGKDDIEVAVKARKGQRDWIAPGVAACAHCIEHEAKITLFGRLTFTAGQ